MKGKSLWLVLLLALTLGVAGCMDDDDNDNNDSNGGSSHTLKVENTSSYTVWYLYVSPTTDDTWGSDVLGASVISPGSTHEHTVNDCDRNYDLRAEDDSSGYWERWDITLSCGATLTWTLTD